MQTTHTNSSPAAAQPPLPGNTQEWRALSNLLSLWALCDRAACRRARACRGDARRCIADCSHLVPPDVRIWVAELLACKRDGLSYDEARLSLPRELEQSWSAWNQAVFRITDRRARRGSPP